MIARCVKMMVNITVHSEKEPMPIEAAIFKGFIVVRLGSIANGIELYIDEKDATAIVDQIQTCLAQIKNTAHKGTVEKDTSTIILPKEEEESNVA
jgi:hypothetical protein